MNIGQLGNLGQLGANGAKGLWTPNALGSALQFWVDANDESSITLNGSRVAQWNDLSGNGRNLGQVTSGQQPEWITGAINEVRSDATNDSMSTSGFSISQPFARFSVLTRRSTGNGTILNSIGASPNNALATTSSTQINVFGGSASITSAQTFSLAQRSQFAEMFNGASSLLFNNGTSTGPTNIGTNGLNGVRISGGTQLSTGFHSILVMNRVPTTDERQRIEGYLAHRYNIQSSLPGGHPFRDLPPTI
jgi:hypothetical protein